MTTLTALPVAVAPATQPPTTQPPTPQPRPRLRRVPYEPDPGAHGSDPPLPPPPAPAPPERSVPEAERDEAHRAATRVLRLALEVLDGRRPSTQLAGHVDPPVLRYWRAATYRRHVRAPARFSRMRVCLPRSGVAEVAVTCEIDGRPRALAARFDRRHTAWTCTALRLG